MQNAECRIIYTSSVGFAATFPSGQRGRLMQNAEFRIKRRKNNG